MSISAPAALPIPTRRSGETWGLWSLRLAGDVEKALSEPGVLESVAERLASEVSLRNLAAVAGASPIGRRLAERVAQLSGAPYLGDGQSADSLAIIDAFVNTGVTLVAATRAARAGGVASVVAIAALGQRAAVERWAREGEQIVVLEAV
jgi:hypothetical protein